jgi:ATP-dependent Clp protease ATP-binding subunit ClpA
MHDRFTDQARRVLRLASDEADRLQHDHVGTEHLLLALLREGNNLGARVLTRLGIELRTLRLMVEAHLPAGSRSSRRLHTLPQTPRLRSILETAAVEARRMGHDFFVGPEHLLLGLLGDEEGTAALLLTELGHRVQDVRAVLLADPGLSALPEFSPRSITTAPAPVEPADETLRRAEDVDHPQTAPPPAAPASTLKLELPDLDRPIVRERGLSRWWHMLIGMFGGWVADEAPRQDEWSPDEDPEVGRLFTERLREVMRQAGRQARRLDHEYVGTEHLLLALIEDSGGGTAVSVLRTLGVDPNQIHQEIEKFVQVGPSITNAFPLTWTPRARKVIEYALAEAQHMGQQHVRTEHLLLGLLREQEGLAAQVLLNLGVRMDAVRREVQRLLGSG